MPTVTEELAIAMPALSARAELVVITTDLNDIVFLPVWLKARL
jgi:hypothetical protein